VIVDIRMRQGTGSTSISSAQRCALISRAKTVSFASIAASHVAH
jgi:hypothetical protein